MSFQTVTARPTTIEPVHRASPFATEDTLSARAPPPLRTRSIGITPPLCPHRNRTTIPPRPPQPPRPGRPRLPARAQGRPAAAGCRVLRRGGSTPGSTRRRLAVQQIHEGDNAGIDGAEQQHDPMYESPDRVDYETDFGGRHGVACPATCCEGHARTTTEDSGDNTGDSSPGSSSTGSSTLRPGRSISSVKTDCGPREEEGEGEGEEESQRAYQAGAGQPSESANAPGPAASVRMAYRPGEETTNSACLAAAGRRPSTSSSSDSSDSASSVKTTDSSEEVVPESTSHWGM